ncbi:MAG: hypothetical protein JRD89_08775 [Deltaproteobacteria bacterium]|nr:hypothetical protein [Deltaproteobacteria bacterium]
MNETQTEGAGRPHEAIIKVDSKLLLQFLLFDGGEIVKVVARPGNEYPDYLELWIKHPDLPKVPAHERVSEIIPTYVSHWADDGTLLRIERVNPPAGESGRGPTV